MTERGTKTLIGGFVLAGIGLLIAGVILIGSGNLFSKNVSFALFFDSSLRGLIPGAPVYFKGVPVGKVTSIQINTGGSSLVISTPVIIEMESSLIAHMGDGPDGKSQDVLGDAAYLDELIRRGLRARLGMQSFVTGQLSVDLDMIPTAEPVDPASLPNFRGLRQIPTVPSSLDAMIDVISRIPLVEIGQDVKKAVGVLSEQISRVDLPAFMTALRATVNDVRAEVAHWSQIREELSVALASFSSAARAVGDHADTTFRRADAAMASISALAEASGAAVDNIGKLTQEDSATMLEFNETMRALREAALAVSDLATVLELRPESLIFGRNR